MSEEQLMKYNLTFLLVTVVTDTGLTAVGHLVQYAAEGGKWPGIHPAMPTSMMHRSPLRGPLFLYQTPSEVDAALVEFNEKRQSPIYFIEPSGLIEHAHGEKLAYNWPNKCTGVVTLRPTMQK